MYVKTKTGYKLFEENGNGQLFPLFIGAKSETKTGVWLRAEYLPTKGFAKRGGWHIGSLPDAPWLKGYDGSETGCYKSRWKTGRRVWCLVEYNATTDYNSEVAKLPGKCFADKVPENGYYFFREAGKGTWSITSDIRIVRKLTERERKDILKSAGYDEVKEYAKYKTAFEKRRKVA